MVRAIECRLATGAKGLARVKGIDGKADARLPIGSLLGEPNV
jgi:hypothetical protein